LLPPLRSVDNLRERGHSFSLPDYNTNTHKKSFDVTLCYVMPHLKFLALGLPVPNLWKGLKFKIQPLDPDHVPFTNILSSVRWDVPSSTSIPNLKFLASRVPRIRRRCHAMAGMEARGGVPKLTRGSPSIFNRPTRNLASI